MEPPNFLKLGFLLILLICVVSADEKDSTKHDVFDELTRSESYDKRIVPTGKNGNWQNFNPCTGSLILGLVVLG